MPIYDYYCNKCNNTFEEIKSITKSDEDSICPKCKGKAKRIFIPSNCHGTFTFLLKGWGWSMDNYDGVHKERWRQKNVFNRDGTLKSRVGDKNDWPDEKYFDMKSKKKEKVKSGHKQIKKVK